MTKFKKGSYSGSIDFDFEIERYKNLKTGEYLLYKDVPSEDIDNEELYDYQVITLKVSGNGHHYPGKYHGPWEDSFPDDTECEIESVTDSQNNDWSAKLTEPESSYLKEVLIEKIQDDSDHFDEPDYNDRGYDYDY